MNMNGPNTRSRAAAARIAEAEANRHPLAVSNFREGVRSVLKQWTALELAVYHEWGGQSSAQRAEELRDEIVEMFLGPDKIYKDDITLVLEDYLETHFNTICEDGSPDELGELFVQMWRDCCNGDFTLVTNILAKEFVRHEMISKSQGLDSGDVVDDDDEMDANQQEQILQQEVEIKLREEQNHPTNEPGQLENSTADNQTMDTVDADGWQTVKKGKKVSAKHMAKAYQI